MDYETTDKSMTQNIITTGIFSKGNINAYIYYLQETGEESFKLLIDISEAIITPSNFRPTKQPLASFLVESK